MNGSDRIPPSSLPVIPPMEPGARELHRPLERGTLFARLRREGRSGRRRGAMTSFPNSPRLLKGGIVLIDPASATAAYEAQQQ
jgi:hypothetical protein